MENPAVVRQKEDKDLVINILGQLIKRYKQQLGKIKKQFFFILRKIELSLFNRLYHQFIRSEVFISCFAT